MLEKCSPCHTRTDPAPASGFGINYASSQVIANSAPCTVQVDDEGQPRPITQGECAFIRLHVDIAGSPIMPRGRGCTGDPSIDADNAACLTEAEQQTLIDWINDGQLD